ncbi:hypothetical protein [Tessaracoccus antarcticus]|nr:hypothetical protein [Tessaracoccus antarcticus]
MTEYNINESTINENPEDKQASDQAAAEAHEPAEGLESTKDDDRITPEKVGDAAIKFATETAYAAAGFAGLVGEKAKAFYDEQRKQYVDAHPEEDGAKANSFLDQLSDQLSRFAEDLSRGYRDLAEKGREVVNRSTSPKQDGTTESAVNDGETSIPAEAATFSSDLSEDVTEKEPETDQVLGDAGKHDGIL